VLLSDLEEAGLLERDQDGGVAIVVQPESFVGSRTGAHVAGQYDSQAMTGTMDITANGP
jgi:hypothetical protein